MKRSILVLTVLVLALAFGTACKRTVPIQDYGNGGLSSYGKLTANQVADAIVRGGSNIGWRMSKVKPGLIQATWVARDHSVTVDIPYTTEEYTIKYNTSTNFLAENGQIHRNYPRWIDRLNRNISAEISKIRK